MDEDEDIPITLGRPYLNTRGILIDVKHRKLTLRLALIGPMQDRLLRVLRDNKEAFGWTIHDIKGIRPTICTHRIYIEDNY
ncbi:hypothetical protein CR513_48037, partial [Mucuna pruriens]